MSSRNGRRPSETGRSMPHISARLTGWGRYAPAQVLTNADLERMVDTSDEWIVSRTGIRERRVAAADETTASMGAVAARRAIAVGQIIGLIEAMKLFNEIKSDLAGRVVRVVAESGQLVKAKQPLIEVEPL